MRRSCSEVLDPKSKRRFGNEAFPNGALLYMPRGESEDLPFDLRIRDVSRRRDRGYYIEFRGHSVGWAFASVTNNVTQQVTIIAPDRKGGGP